MKELREYQKKIVEDVMSTNDNVLVSAPTGSGKTVMISAVIKEYAKLKQKCVFLVPAIDLLAQSKKQFEENGLTVGIIWKNYDDHLKDVDVYIGTRQTMYRRVYFKSWIQDKIVIVDEAHIGLDRQCSDYTDALRLIGLTATPEQTDGSSMLKKAAEGRLPGCYDRVVKKCSIKQLTNEGYLAKMRLVEYPGNIIQEAVVMRYKQMGKQDIPDANMREYLLLANEYIKRNIINKCIETKEPAILFFPGVDSANEFLLSLDNKAFALSEIVTAETPSSERQRIYKDVEDGKKLFLINCAVLTTGFDLPKIKNLVLARCVLSKDLFYQIIGRALRPYENKDACIYDIFNSYENIKSSTQTCIESPEWKPEGWLKSVKSSLERAFANASSQVKNEFEIDPDNSFKMLIGELQDAYEILLAKVEDLNEAADQMESELKLEETIVEKVVEKQVIAKPEQQQCISLWKAIDFQQKNKITARVLRDLVFDYKDTTEDYNKYTMIQVMLAIVPETVVEIWDDPKYSVFVEQVAKYCSWWVENFDYATKNDRPVKMSTHTAAQAYIDNYDESKATWLQKMEYIRCTRIENKYSAEQKEAELWLTNLPGVSI